MASRRTTSWHEACHAVTARVLRMEVVGVTMFQTDASRAPASVLSRCALHYAEQDTASQIAACEIDAKVALAGPVGDALHSKARFRRMKGIVTDDIETAHSYAARIALPMAGETVPEVPPGETREADVDIETANLVLQRLTGETKVLLTENWAAVERVAQALMSSDLLDQAEIDRLMGLAKTPSSRPVS
jgi:ATP-dependent Zn protease